jgi:methionyl-tRNA formyltransferase
VRVLYLGPISPLVGFIAKTDDVICSELESLNSPDFIVSYGYRKILPAEVCKRFDGRAINLHIGLLPWNRGAHPNLWSAIDGTPNGVTIHYIDSGIDTGDIIAQKELTFSRDETLKSSYDTLRLEIEELFRQTWPEIREGRAPRTKQTHPGSYHRKSDLPELPRGWGTKLSVLSERFGAVCAGDVFA